MPTGAAETRGQAKNNADVSGYLYGGRQNRQEKSIFPAYLGTCNIHPITTQSRLRFSPPLCQSCYRGAYVPEPGGPWSAPCPAALLSAFLLCLHTYLLPLLPAYHPAAPLCVPPGTSPHTRLRLLAASSPGQGELGQFLTPGTALGSKDTHALGRQSTPSRRAASLLGGQRSPPRALYTNTATRSHSGGTGAT